MFQTILNRKYIRQMYTFVNFSIGLIETNLKTEFTLKSVRSDQDRIFLKLQFETNLNLFVPNKIDQWFPPALLMNCDLSGCMNFIS
jgi:hypothetical protein